MPVVRDEQGLTQQRLAVSPGELSVQVLRRILNHRFERGKIVAEGDD